MPDGAKILDLMDEIEQLPGYRFYYEDVKGLELSTYIFYANFNDMNRLITLVTTHPKFAHLFNPANKETLHTFGYDIVRRVHNFLASVASLVDHTQNIHKKLYKGTNLFPDYQDRVDRDFTNDIQVQFVQELREYSTHYKPPIIYYRTTWGKERQIVRRVYLDREKLKKFGFKAPARKYIATLTDDVDILQEVTIYRDKVLAFYEWFGSRQMEIHAAELKEFNDKQEELRRLYEE